MLHKTILVAVASVGLATAAFAEPRLMSVTNLDAGDHLNVRSEASARSDDLGDLQAGDIVEIVATSEDRKWGKFLWGEANGWAAMRYLTDAGRIVLRNGLPVGLACSGTEPFWSAKIETSFTFQPFGQDPVEGGMSSAKTLDGYTFNAAGISGALKPEACSDGMSDRDYGWSLGLKLENGFELQGCCTDASAVTRF